MREFVLRSSEFERLSGSGLRSSASSRVVLSDVVDCVRQAGLVALWQENDHPSAFSEGFREGVGFALRVVEEFGNDFTCCVCCRVVPGAGVAVWQDFVSVVCRGCAEVEAGL